MPKKINEEIEKMTAKLEKASKEPQELLIETITSLGQDIRERVSTLTDDEKVVLKAALEEMSLQKAISFDKEAQGAKVINGKLTDTILQEEKADDDADEKLVKPEAAKMDHQGTKTDGWEGQVIKAEVLEQHLDEIIEKAMAKCDGDEKMVMDKLSQKVPKEKVQGALDKFKKKKDMKKSEDEVEKAFPKEEAKDKIMDMEEKEHGTKDPKKLVEAEKKEHMKKSLSWEGEDRLLKANTQGRNFSFNVESFITETLKNEPKEEIKKSETPKEDVNDLIEKSMDRSWTQENHRVIDEDSQKKTNGTLVKSFNETSDLAHLLGLTEEEAKKILG